MENENNKRETILNKTGKMWAGVFVTALGAALLLDRFIDLPQWLMSWSTLLIALGVALGFKRDFRGIAWLVLVMVGVYFTARKTFLTDGEAYKVLFPALLIVLGLFLILKPKSHGFGKDKHRRGKDFSKKRDHLVSGDLNEPPVSSEDMPHHVVVDSRNDYLDSANVFGGSHQIVYSKSFKGGDIVAVFGSCDVNLLQADFEGEVVLETIAIFGGVKIVIPQGWAVKHEAAAILGGVDDKRAVLPMVAGAPQKVLIVRGLALFGGIEIVNY